MKRMRIGDEWRDVDEKSVLMFRAKAGGLRLTIKPSETRVTGTGQAITEQGHRIIFLPLSPVKWLKIGPGSMADNKPNSWLRGKFSVLHDQYVINGKATIEDTEKFLLDHPNYWRNVLLKDPKALPNNPSVFFMTEEDWDEWEIEEHKRVREMEERYIKAKEKIREENNARRSKLRELHVKKYAKKGDKNVETNPAIPGDETQSII